MGQRVRGLGVGRDLIAGYAEALREQDLKVGLYYSHSDWSHPDYASTRKPGRPPELEDNRYSEAAEEDEDLDAWERFIAYRDGQVRELTSRYRPDLMWFDGEWERSAEQWRIPELAALIRAEVPRVVLNARMLGEGDYATPEQGAPVVPPEGPWELCLTINDSWGHQHHDRNHKSVDQLIRYFTETIGGGGNLLLSVGPRRTARSRTSRPGRSKDWATGSAGTRTPCTGRCGGCPPGTTTARAPSRRTAGRCI